MTWRVRDRATFAALRQGSRTRRGPITITHVASDPGSPPRVAYAIGRPVGNAVRRNRLRRRLRAVLAKTQLPPGAYLISARPDAAHLSFENMTAAVASALNDLTLRGANRPRASSSAEAGAPR